MTSSHVKKVEVTEEKMSTWCVLNADGIVLCGTTREVVEKKLEEWRRAMENRGPKINRNNTVYLRFNGDGYLDGNSNINLQGENLERVNLYITLRRARDVFVLSFVR